MLYADYNAARPPDPNVLAAYLEAMRACWGNPSSPHRLGRLAKRAIEDARQEIASLLQAKPSELIFTAGASEANFMALLGASPASRPTLLSQVEHPSLLSAAEQMLQRGHRIVWVKTPHQLPEAIQQHQPGLVSVMLAQNETGEIFPVRDIARAAREVGALVHCDAVQALGRIPVSPDALGVDLLSISGRKLSGVGASGALFVRRGVQLSPLMPGSAESGQRAGTLPAESLVAFGAAAKIARSEMPAVAERLARYKAQLKDALQRKIPGLHATTGDRPCLENTLHLLLPSCDGEELVSRLDAVGICASTGAACSSGRGRPSHVLLAMGYSPEEARSSLRISLGAETTLPEIEQLQRTIPAIYQESLLR